MTATATMSQAQQVQTLPRLVAINKNFTDLNEQIEQARNIVGLPERWTTLKDGNIRHDTAQRIGRAKAEWVLRWILDKLKDGTSAGVQARSHLRAWKLLHWMIDVLPATQAAAHLQDADFLSILESTVRENFDEDFAAASTKGLQETANHESEESSETLQEEGKPSRKRKRSSGRSDGAPKKVDLGSAKLVVLFREIISVLKSVASKDNAENSREEAEASHGMKMVLQTETAQAARILKGWLIAVGGLFISNSGPGSAREQSVLDLSPVLQIWDLRVIDSEDSTGASADQFSAECLIPLLTLYAHLRENQSATVVTHEKIEAMAESIQHLETLLMAHVFVPSRKAFFAQYGSQQGSTDVPESGQSDQLANNLEPLRAKILQAAQIQDTSDPVPEPFLPLFKCIPRLLDLAIRKSASRTPKSRIADRPWIQAVFVSLAECAGCPLEAPKFQVHTLSRLALQGLLEILASHDIKIDASVLTAVFWYHSGPEYPRNARRTINWPLIAALVKLDADIFVSRPGLKSEAPASEGMPADLTRYLFDQISTNFVRPSVDEDAMDIDHDDRHGVRSAASHQYTVDSSVMDAGEVVQSIIVPVMSAFARNRDLLGFIHHWDTQLCAHAPFGRQSVETPHPIIWETRGLGRALEERLEKSLTPSQIVNLVRIHSERVKPPRTESTELASDDRDAFRKAQASSVILRVLLLAIHSDDIIQALRDQMISLTAIYSGLVRDSWYWTHTDLPSNWMILCQLVIVLWPLHLHSSRDTQQEVLEPLLRRAVKDISTKDKKEKEDSHPKMKQAALLFLLTASNLLQTVPGWDDILKEAVRKSLKFIFSGQSTVLGHTNVSELFCTEFAQLLDCLEPDSRQDQLLKVLKRIAELGLESAQSAVDTLSHTLFTSTDSAMRTAFAAALIDALEQGKENRALLSVVKVALPHIRPSALPREQREAVLDKITEASLSDLNNVELFLSVMATLQEVPNATSKIASNGGSFFDIAQSLHDHGHESANTLRIFQDVVQLTLSHILPNKEQSQNKKYLEKFIGKLTSTKPRRWFPARLAVARAGFLAQKENEILSWEQYSALLTGSLESKLVPSRVVMDAINELPASFLNEHGDIGPLTKTINVRSFGSDGKEYASTLDKKDKALTFALVAKARLFPNVDWFLELSRSILATAAPDDGRTILGSFKDAALSLPLAQQLNAAFSLIQSAAANDEVECFRLLHALVSTLNDKLDDDDMVKQQQISLLPLVCTTLDNIASVNSSSLSALLDTIDTIVKDKPFLTSQHNIECVLTSLARLASRSSQNLSSSDGVAIYTRLCQTTRYILLLQRSRLGGRFHLLMQLLQRLLSCLFIPHPGRQHMLPGWLSSPSSSPIHLTPANASQYARILSTLCSPTQSSVSKAYQHRGASNTKTTLNDPVKAAREYVSHYIYPLLAAFCRCQLNGRLDAGVREKLMPGIWEVVGTAEMDKESLQAMYQGLDKSSREIWKGLWAEWSRLHGRKQGV